MWKNSLQTVLCRDLAAQHKGELSVPNPADKNVGGTGLKSSQLLKSEQKHQGDKVKALQKVSTPEFTL